VTLDDLVAAFKKHLHLADPYALLAVAGAAAGNRLDGGEPCWLALVGPPSSGKTELVVPFLALDGFEHCTATTFAGLLTDPGRHGTGGALARLGERGTLGFTDLSGLFAERGDEESRLLAALREVHDGRLTRHVGGRGGRTVEWPGGGRRGRVGLLACVTDVVDLHVDLVNAMGPRMVFARMPPVDHRAVIAAAARNVGRLDTVRADLAAAVLDLFRGVDPGFGADALGVLDEARRDVAEFAAIARSAPSRVGGRIVLVPAPEVGARLYAGLSQLRRGLDALGCAPELASEVERRVGLDSIPALKRHLIEHLKRSAVIPPRRAIAADLGYPPATVLDTLEDLAAYHIVQRIDDVSDNEDRWTLTYWARQRVDTIGLDVTRSPVPSLEDELDDVFDPLDLPDRDLRPRLLSQRRRRMKGNEEEPNENQMTTNENQKAPKDKT
jgi:hypothetical protein